MTISFSGLASGLDTSSWVESLVALKQAKIDTLKEEKENVVLSQETLNSIKSFFSSFRSVIEKITDAQFGIPTMDLFAQNVATSANLDILTASATTEAEEAEYNVQVNQLATNTAANSYYGFMTTIVQTTTATEDSKLINLGIKAGDIGVNVDGIERGITITENDTIKTLIDKFNEIGVSASFNEKTGLFSVDISADDINDIGNTGIVEGLHLEGVNEGYESNELKTSSTDTVFSAATEDTLLSELGVKTGVITVEANDKSYDITIDTNSTLGSLIEDFADIDVLATLSEEGYLTISDAKITGEGTTNFTDALGLEFDVYSNSQTSGDLSHETIITQVTTATSDTLLSDLGDGINITDGQTVIIKNSNNELTTITVNKTTTLGMLLEDMTNAGLYANLNSDGTVEITGGTITGGTFDAIAALGLKVEPHSSMTTGKPLTETVEHFELVTMDTLLVDDLKVRAGYLEVTDADGNKFYEKIYHGQTLGDFMADLGNLGIYTKLRDDGVLEITGGAFATLSDDRVKQLIADGTIRETDARYMQGSDILTALYGSPVISTDQITVASTYSKTQALTHKVTNTINASLTTTLGNLGLSGNGTAIFEVRGKNRTINVTQADSIQTLIDKLKNVGIEASWNSDTHKITIENAVINGGTSNLEDVLNLTETVSGKYVTSNALSRKETITVDATEDTRLAEFGISNSMSEADRTVKLYNSDGTLAGSITVNENTTIGDLLDFINTHNNITSRFEDGVFVIDNGYIENTTLENGMGLDTSNKSSFALGNSITITNVVAATATTRLDEIISFTDGTISVYNKDHSLAGTFVLDGTSTINEFFGALSQYNISATINDGIISLISSDGAYIKGDIIDALGIELRSTFVTITSGITNTSSSIVSYEQTHIADKETTFGDLGIGTSSILVRDNSNSIIATINTSGSTTIDELFKELAKYEVNAEINDGMISIFSPKGNYVTGDLATKLGIDTTEVITTTTVGTINTSSSTITYTQEHYANWDTTFSQLGIGNGSITVFNKNGSSISTINISSTESINDLFDKLEAYGITGSISDGIISLSSAKGYYIEGSIADALGIETKSEFVTTTSGISNTSSDSIKYLVTMNATMTDDFLLTTGMEKNREYNIVYNYIDPDKFSSSGNLGALEPLHTYTVKYTDSEFIIDGPTSYTISLDDTLTFAEFFNAFASSLGVNGSIDDGIVQLDADDDVYLTGDFITDVLQVSPNSNTTITKTIGISNTGTSQSYLSVTQEVTTYSYKTVFHGTTTVTITTTAEATATVTVTMTTTVGGGLTFPSLDSYWSDITGGGIKKIELNYDGFSTVYTPGTWDTIRDFVDELNTVFPGTTATIEDGVLTFHVKTTRLDGEDQPANLTGSISFTSKDGTVWSSSITSDPRVYVTMTITPTTSTKLGTWRESKDKMTLTLQKGLLSANTQTFTFTKEDTVGDVIEVLNNALNAPEGGITLVDGKLQIKASGLSINNALQNIEGDVADMLGISISSSDYTRGKIFPTTSSSEVYAADGTLYESNELLYTLLYTTVPASDYIVTITCSPTSGTGGSTTFSVNLKTETLDDLIAKFAAAGITASYENHLLTIGSETDTAFIMNCTPNALSLYSALNVPFLNTLTYPMMSIDKEIDLTKKYVDAKYNCDINMSAGIIDNGSGYIDYITGTKTITISTTATGSKTITVDITATCTATQTVPVTVTEMMTLNSSFAQLGLYSSSDYINVMYEGTAYTITITSDNTVWDMVSALGGYGISAIIHNGAITIQGTHNGYITSMSNGVKRALGMNYVSKWSETKLYQNYTYIGSTLTIQENRTLASDTKLSELGFTGSGTINVNYEGDDYALTFRSDATIDDIITSLSGLGVNGYILDGRLTLRGTNDGYITNISSNLQTALKLKAAGNGNTWTTTVNEIKTNTNSEQQKYNTTETMKASTTLGELGVNTLQTVSVNYEGKNYTLEFSNTNSIDDIISSLAGLGISGEILNGKLTLTGTNNGYITDISNGLVSALKLKTAGNGNTWVSYTNTTVTNTTSDDQSYTHTHTLNSQDTLANLGMTGSGSITVNYEGDSYTITFKSDATIDDIISSLAGLGINGFVLEGKLTLRGTEKGYITNISSNIQTALKLKAAGNGNTWTTTVNEICTNTNSDRQTHSVIENMDKDTLLADLGVTGGNILITQEGVSYTVNVDTTKIKTVSDFMNFLAQYGFNSQIDAEGRLVVTGKGESYLTSLTGGSNIIDVFGLKDWNMGSVSQTSDELSDKKTIVQETTLDTKLSELTDAAGNSLGITSGNIYVYQDGTRYLVNISNNDTLKTLAAKLSQYGISMELSSDGKLYFEGNNNSYMTTNGISSGASNILQKLNILDNWSERYDSTSDNLSYTVVVDNVVSNSTKLSDLQDKDGNNLGITEGTFYIYNNGVRNTATITADMTVNDLKAMLAEHGLIVDISENGEISVGAYGNTYLATSALAGQNSNIVSTLFEEWDFVNIYTSNNLEIPQDIIEAVDRDTKLSDINEGVYQAGFITVVKNGVQTNIELTADDTIGTLMDELALYGFESVLNENGQLIIKNTGDSLLQKYTGAGQASNALELLGIDLDSWIQTNSYQSSTLSVVTTSTLDTAVTMDTELSLLGVTTGEYFIYNNGVKYTAYISTGETMKSFLETLKSFGIEASLVTRGDSSILTIKGSGDSYITKSTSTTNASNVVEQLFGDLSHDSSYQYKGLEETSEIITNITSATEDTLLSYYDSPWGNTTLKAEGKLSVKINDETAIIDITADETFGSLIKKFEALGLEASISSDGQLMIQSGFNTFTINNDGTTSSLLTTIGLKYKDDLGGYASSSVVTEATTTAIEERTLSVANFAGYDTKMGLLNISDGTLSIYRNGEKATIEVDSDETFAQFRARIASAFSDVDITFEDGYLKFFSKDGNAIEVGATTDTSNFSAITGLTSDGSGVVKSARELYSVNSDSVITSSGLFRRGNVTEGTFVVGNATFNITGTTTLADLIAQINSSDEANATAYWDSIQGKFVITSRTTGSALVNIESGTSNFTDIMGYTNTKWNGDGSVDSTKMNIKTQTVGKNAMFTINGTAYTSSSNTITSDISRIKGVTLNLKGLTEGESVKVTVERDKETLANAVSDIVDAYNELITNVDEAIAIDGQLHDQSLLKLIRNQLRTMMTSTDAGTTVFRNLDSIGIKVDSASANNITTEGITELTFDKDKFIQAYEADQDAVKALLIGSDSNKGVFTKVEELVESTLESVTGYFATADDAYQREINSIDDKIEKQQRALERYRAQLEAKFASMDILIANMQQQYSSFLVT